ncbi:MAG: aminoacyl-tRNA hydrolase [Candidatus Jorgensenbacteria bacterium]
MLTEFKWSRIKVVAGLGNPGAAYRYTRHNAGMEALYALTENAPLSKFATPPKKRFSFLRHGTHVFVAPTTFMNESGGAVTEALRYFRIKNHEELLLLHDDADLPVGACRLQFGRGAAGHHGVQSVITSFGTKDFWRLRIGVRPATPRARGRAKAGDFVLRPMTASERDIIKKTAESVIRSSDTA